MSSRPLNKAKGEGPYDTLRANCCKQGHQSTRPYHSISAPGTNPARYNSPSSSYPIAPFWRSPTTSTWARTPSTPTSFSKLFPTWSPFAFT